MSVGTVVFCNLGEVVKEVLVSEDLALTVKSASGRFVFQAESAEDLWLIEHELHMARVAREAPGDEADLSNVVQRVIADVADATRASYTCPSTGANG